MEVRRRVAGPRGPQAGFLGGRSFCHFPRDGRLEVFAGLARAQGCPLKGGRQEGRVEFVEACQPKRPIRPTGQAKKAVNKRRFAAD